ncbi:MAG: alpha/beta hydrolase [Ilumatobacter sp.]
MVAVALTACSGSSSPGRYESVGAGEPAPSTAQDEATDDGSVCTGPVANIDTFSYRSIDDVDPDLLALDVYRTAAAASCPVVVYVHGGSWQAGDKRTRATEVKAEHLVGEGFVFISANYRLVAADNDVRWPDFGDDVAVAVAWVIENAASIGADPDRVSIVGHSAGAHLVSIIGTNPDLLGVVGLERDAVQCVVSLDAVDHRLADAPSYERDIVGLAFGREPSTLDDGSPTVQAIEHAADGPMPEFLIVTRGRTNRLESSEQFRAAIANAGGSATVLDVSPYDHRDANVRFGEPGETLLTAPVTQFVLEC